ncbi:MAG: VOC family protein [Bacteroidota bacterium]
MKQLQPYLAFQGKCEEALNFYVSALGGEIVSVMRFSEAPNEMPPELSNNILHAVFKAGQIAFMASDGMPDHPHVVGNNINLSIDLDTEEEQTQVFDKLAEGGTVTMPLNDTFWGSRFGMLVDKYGINWMLSVEKPK